MALSAYVQDDQESTDQLSEKVVWVEITKEELGVVLVGYNSGETPITKTHHRNTEAAKHHAGEFDIREEHWFES